MGKIEVRRIEVMQRLKKKRLKQREAAKKSGIDIREVKRLLRAYHQCGAEG